MFFYVWYYSNESRSFIMKYYITLLNKFLIEIIHWFHYFVTKEERAKLTQKSVERLGPKKKKGEGQQIVVESGKKGNTGCFISTTLSFNDEFFLQFKIDFLFYRESHGKISFVTTFQFVTSHISRLKFYLNKLLKTEECYFCPLSKFPSFLLSFIMQNLFPAWNTFVSWESFNSKLLSKNCS